MKTFLGIDWGGTYVKAGIVDEKGNILKKKKFSSYCLGDKEPFFDNIRVLLDDFSDFTVAGIGIGVPGIVNVEQGFIYYLPNVPGWEEYPLKSILQKRLNLPVYIDNDANVFALAEARVGAAKEVKRALFLTLGTGLGGAVIFDGKVLEGATSSSEVGHVPISLKGQACGCGGKGCIETFVGSRYLLKKYNRLKKNKEGIKEVKRIFINARKGEKEALKIWEDFSYALGMFLAGMINVFNPEKIILSGGMAGAFDLFRPMLWEVIKKQAMLPQLVNLKIVRTKLDNPGVVGAGLLVKEYLD